MATGRVSENVLLTTHVDSLVPICSRAQAKVQMFPTLKLEMWLHGHEWDRNAQVCPSDGAQHHTAVDRRQVRQVSVSVAARIKDGNTQPLAQCSPTR